MTKQSIGISGRVIHGEHYGKALGFPTANLDRRQYSRQKTKIRLGVWGGWAELPSGKKYPAAIVIGPPDNRRLPKIEAHLIGFKGNLYGESLRIYLNIYLRPFKKFTGTEDLKRQIWQDIVLIKHLKFNGR